jgi:HlyD family secretion protein
MSAIRLLICATLAFGLAACGNNDDKALQGWVEADFIFVSPDEAGRVDSLHVREGETVPAGRPVLALLPPSNLKIRFYAPQAQLPIIKIGDEVTVSCDNCQQGLTARVSFISRTNEFTPPVIYSLEERAKLVYLIEAHPEHPEKFRVGQPVSVKLAEEAKK